MLDTTQIAYVAFILIAFGSLAFYLAHKLSFPRVAFILMFGLLCGVTGILNRDWFDPMAGSEFPLKTMVELVLIVVLFFGGYSVDIKSLKGVLRPGVLSATLGAFMVTFILAFILNLTYPTLFGTVTALIVGGLLAPIDPVAVTSAQDTFQLNPKVSNIQRFESGLDDTMVTTLNLLICVPLGLSLESSSIIDINAVIWNGVGSFFWLAGSAVGIGLGMGYGFSFIYKKVKQVELRMIANVMLPFLTFYIASLPVLPNNQPLSSGYVSVFIAGFVFGRRMLKNEEEYRRVHKIWGYAFKFCEITCFMILGVLVRPDSFLMVLGPALVLMLSIMFVTRPLQIFTCMAKTDLKVKDKLFIAYMGLKGLDPAVLAIAAFESLNGLTNPHVTGVNLLINLTFTVIIFVTIGQSTLLTLLYGKRGIFNRKSSVAKSIMGEGTREMGSQDASAAVKSP